MRAIILAGGFGTRVAAIANGRPKPLLKVGGRTLLEHQIEFLRARGVGNIRVSVHYKADEIVSFAKARWPGRMEFVAEEKPLGTGGAIKLASSDFQVGEDFLVLNCDNLIGGIDLGAFALRGAPTIGCAFLDDARDYGLLDVAGERVRKFLEKPQEKASGYVNCGWYVLSRKVFDGVKGDVFMLERDVFPRLARSGALKAYIHHDWWIDAGTAERLAEAERYLRREGAKG